MNCALLKSIRDAASKLKDGKLKRLNLVAPALKRISAELGFDSDEQAMVFVAILDRQCGCRNSDLDDISNYFEISSLDVMQFVPAINALISKGYLTVENRSEALLTRKQFMVCPDVFYAVIEGRKVEPVMVTEKDEYDQFDFCLAVSKLKEDRKSGSIETRKLFICVEKMEADAVFSKRKDSNSSSVAQTENAIQNIILEEMENLDGILIATTNLADNLDKAFERRFLFKIRFDRPSVEAKKNIWMDKLHSLSSSEAQMLASRYDFSGGEIDNITRKVIMSEVIDGTRPSIDTIVELCDQEKLAERTIRVGF